MNLTELRDELHNRAEEAAVPPTITGAAIRRIRSRQRARAVAAAVGCVVVLGAGAVVTQQLGRSASPTPAGPTVSHPVTPSPVPTIGPDGMPSRPVPDLPGDVVRDGLRYRAKVAGDTLAAGEIGAAGQGSVSLTWTPTQTQVSLSVACWLPGAPAPTSADTGVWAKVTLDGGSVFLSGCSSDRPVPGDLQTSKITLSEPGSGRSELTAGKPATVTFQVIDGRTKKPVTDGSVRVAGAAYDLGPQTTIINPTTQAAVAAVPTWIEHEGYDYVLSGTVVADASSGLEASSRTPGGIPFLMMYGSAGSDGSSPAGTTYLTGLGGESSRMEGGGWTAQPQSARGAGKVTLRHEGKRATGSVDFIAIYVPAP
jgi:hypothetical protein